MSDCEEKIYSNDYVDFIISKDVLEFVILRACHRFDRLSVYK